MKRHTIGGMRGPPCCHTGTAAGVLRACLLLRLPSCAVPRPFCFPISKAFKWRKRGCRGGLRAHGSERDPRAWHGESYPFLAFAVCSLPFLDEIADSFGYGAEVRFFAPSGEVAQISLHAFVFGMSFVCAARPGCVNHPVVYSAGNRVGVDRAASLQGYPADVGDLLVGLHAVPYDGKHEQCSIPADKRKMLRRYR